MKKKMKKYVLTDYNQKQGDFYTTVFNSESEAVEEMKYLWEHQTHSEQQRYKTSEARFDVIEIELTEEEFEAVENGEIEKTFDDFSIRTVADML